MTGVRAHVVRIRVDATGTDDVVAALLTTAPADPGRAARASVGSTDASLANDKDMTHVADLLPTLPQIAVQLSALRWVTGNVRADCTIVCDRGNCRCR
jgi:hypothetical protein